MARSVSELVKQWLDGSISASDASELRELCQSNALAMEELIHRAGVAGKDPSLLLGDETHPANEGLAILADSEPDEHPGSPIQPAKPTSIWVRIACAAMLVLIGFGLFATPFLRIKASLLKVVEGEMVTALGNPTPTLEDPAEVSIPSGVTTRLLVRGGAYLTTTGLTKLRVTESGPAARIELLEGTFEIVRPTLKRECFIAYGGLEIEPSIEGGSVTFTVRDNVATAEVTDGKAIVRWHGELFSSLTGEARIVTGDGPTDVIRLEQPETVLGLAYVGTKLRLERGELSVTMPPKEP